ncbi:hypothetical protein P280DRAFT_520292 [Massarina eburnea CBS 473.64]|uniref:Aminoglycoside phosphotransferase domain-containing protein n=1 Tax=Massarina eburnea CBS 473.64 TaxID=1395130 RepID=A0A6A6RTC6_9PLEO|nr:hypothetical protein P280DRAFT_520292 [Massarina eburnea CBS 473.64]
MLHPRALNHSLNHSLNHPLNHPLNHTGPLFTRTDSYTTRPTTTSILHPSNTMFGLRALDGINGINANWWHTNGVKPSDIALPPRPKPFVQPGMPLSTSRLGFTTADKVNTGFNSVKNVQAANALWVPILGQLKYDVEKLVARAETRSAQAQGWNDFCEIFQEPVTKYYGLSTYVLSSAEDSGHHGVRSAAATIAAKAFLAQVQLLLGGLLGVTAAPTLAQIYGVAAYATLQRQLSLSSASIVERTSIPQSPVPTIDSSSNDVSHAPSSQSSPPSSPSVGAQKSLPNGCGAYLKGFEKGFALGSRISSDRVPNVDIQTPPAAPEVPIKQVHFQCEGLVNPGFYDGQERVSSVNSTNTVGSVSKYSLIAVLVQHLEITWRFAFEPGAIVWNPNTTSAGSFHRVEFVTVAKGPSQGTYVIKIPHAGLPETWNALDAMNLESEVLTMKLIHEYTNVPIPQIFGYNPWFEGDGESPNHLGAPYILMSAVKGVPAYKIWDEGDKGKRERFVRSLAETMSGLGAVSFDRTGVLEGYSPLQQARVGHVYTWHYDGVNKHNDGQAWEHLKTQPTFDSAKRYYEYFFAARFPFLERSDSQESHDKEEAGMMDGIRELMRMILQIPSFQKSCTGDQTQETMVLKHDDLNFQNIMCDNTGQVTGIIDWDKARIVPRNIGYAALPLFFIPDYFSGFGANDRRLQMTISDLDKYRRLYAETMIEKTGPDGDGKITLNSGWYQAIDALLNGHAWQSDAADLFKKILRESEQLRRLPIDEICWELGTGGNGLIGHELVQREILEVLGSACLAK